MAAIGLTSLARPSDKALRAQLRLETINAIKPCHEGVSCDGRHSTAKDRCRYGDNRGRS